MLGAILSSMVEHKYIYFSVAYRIPFINYGLCMIKCFILDCSYWCCLIV